MLVSYLCPALRWALVLFVPNMDKVTIAGAVRFLTETIPIHYARNLPGDFGLEARAHQ